MKTIQLTPKNKKILLLEYFVVFLVVFYSGKASLFVGAIESWANPIGLLLPIISVTILGVIKGIQFNYKFLLFLIGYFIYIVASTIKFGALHPRFFAIYFLKFTLIYVVIESLGTRFFRFYEDILYNLCIVAIVFWFFQNIIPTIFIEFLRNFEFSTQGPVKGNVDFNTIIYTVPNFEYGNNHATFNLGGFKIFRNAGYAWEPGGFATYINIAMFINLARNKFSLVNNKQFWIMFVALITTFSTTGYSMFVIIALFYIYNQNVMKIIWLAPIIAVATIFLFTLPFMTEKITEERQYDTKEMIYYSAKYDFQYSTQRFHSLQIDFIDFLNHPIIGYGGHQEARWTNLLGAQIFTVSGMGKILAQFGSVGILFFVFCLWKSSKQIVTLFNVKGAFFLVLLVLMISISYSLFTILYLCIWIFCLTNTVKTEVIRNFTISKILATIKA